MSEEVKIAARELLSALDFVLSKGMVGISDHSDRNALNNLKEAAEKLGYLLEIQSEERSI